MGGQQRSTAARKARRSGAPTRRRTPGCTGDVDGSASGQEGWSTGTSDGSGATVPAAHAAATRKGSTGCPCRRHVASTGSMRSANRSPASLGTAAGALPPEHGRAQGALGGVVGGRDARHLGKGPQGRPARQQLPAEAQELGVAVGDTPREPVLHGSPDRGQGTGERGGLVRVPAP